MATNSLTTLGQFRIGTTDYAAGQARTDGSWHLVRKQYGDNSSTYTYARFTTQADYLAARANPDAVLWLTTPYSSVSYDILLLPLATPLPSSTAGGGADASTAPAATETTLAAVLAQLHATLQVAINGQVSIANFPAGFHVTVDNPAAPTATVAVSNLPTAYWQATQPVSAAAWPLPTGAATAAAQAGQQSTLNSILAAFAALATGGKQDAQQTTLAAIQAALAPAATAALQATANGYLQTLAQSSSAVSLTRYSLVSAAGQNLTLIKTGAVNLYALHLSNNSGATRVVQFFNKATAPAAGDAPVLALALPAGGSFRYALDGKPDVFALGLGFSVGATAGVLTTLTGTALLALAAGDVSVTAHYA